jgi:hypothetical protein
MREANKMVDLEHRSVAEAAAFLWNRKERLESTCSIRYCPLLTLAYNSAGAPVKISGFRKRWRRGLPRIALAAVPILRGNVAALSFPTPTHFIRG